MIAPAVQQPPGGMDLERYREILGHEADGVSDDQLQVQLDADRALARALCSAISTMGPRSAITEAG